MRRERALSLAALLVLAGALVLGLARRARPLVPTPECHGLVACSALCEERRIWACVELGDVYFDGDGAARDPARALELWTRSCDAGASVGCFKVAAMHARKGAADASDYGRRAHELRDKECTYGYSDACYELAIDFADGRNAEPDPERADVLFSHVAGDFERRCEDGAADACSDLGAMFDAGRVAAAPEDVARPFYERGCALGEEASCSLGGFAAEEADDLDAALRLYSRACDLGGADACASAVKAATDPGTKRSLWERMVELRARDCEDNIVSACFKAADHISSPPDEEDDNAAPIDEERARRLTKRGLLLHGEGCDNGVADDCAAAGFVLATGRHVDKDARAAQGFLRRACKLGSEEACSVADDMVGGVAWLAVDHQSCAVEQSGAVWCWGLNSDGELGDGTKAPRRGRIKVEGLAPAAAVDVDSGTSCALTQSAEVWCWGRGHAPKPQRIAREGKPKALAVGYESVCTLDEAGTVSCDGWNKSRHELGATAIASSGMNTCALGGGIMKCWGTLLAPDYDPEPKPVVERADVAAMSVTDDGFCTRMDNGDAVCRGRTVTEEQLPEIKLAGVSLITGDAASGCAIRGVRAWCWSTISAGLSEPTDLVEIRDAQQIAVEPDIQACARVRGGDVLCWRLDKDAEVEPLSFESP